MIDLIWGRYSFLFYLFLLSVISGIAGFLNSIFFVIFFFSFLLFIISLRDYMQKKRSILSNFPLLGRFRFFFESIRPELRQYYWEADDEEVPYSRNQRSMVYQRSKNIEGVRPFGSLEKMYENENTYKKKRKTAHQQGSARNTPLRDVA